MDQSVSDRDVTHIHSEVRQLRNHQFVLSTAALTMFGVVAALLLKDEIGNPPTGEIGYQRSVLAFVLLVLLFVLFTLVRRVANLIHTLSAYLRLRRLSQWELDYYDYTGKARLQSRRYVSQTAMHSLVFITMGLLTMLILVLPFIGKTWDQVSILAFIGLSVSFCLYIIFVGGMGFGGWFFDISTVEERWKAVIEKSERQTA